MLRVRKARGTDQGRRDHALIATLLGTGLRVSELLAIDIAQCNQRGFVHVLRKGEHMQRFIPVQRQHRDVLDAWLEQRGDVPGPLFPTRSGKRLDRTQAFLVLKHVAQQANAHLPPAQHLEVSPHVLRHTLLRKVANEKGVHYAEVYEEARAAGPMPSAGGARQPLAAAPVLIVACINTPASGRSSFQTGASTYPSVQNLLLAAGALGLGRCLTTLHRRRKARIHAMLGIPDHIESGAIIPLGWPDRASQTQNRRSVQWRRGRWVAC